VLGSDRSLSTTDGVAAEAGRLGWGTQPCHAISRSSSRVGAGNTAVGVDNTGGGERTEPFHAVAGHL